MNPDLIPANGKSGRYEFIDAGAQLSKGYTYWLQEVQTDNTMIDYPNTATVQPAGGQTVKTHYVFIPAVMR